MKPTSVLEASPWWFPIAFSQLACALVGLAPGCVGFVGSFRDLDRGAPAEKKSQLWWSPTAPQCPWLFYRHKTPKSRSDYQLDWWMDPRPPSDNQLFPWFPLWPWQKPRGHATRGDIADPPGREHGLVSSHKIWCALQPHHWEYCDISASVW